MNLTNVTEIFRFCILDRRALAAVASLLPALATPAFARQPDNANGSGILIVSQQSAAAEQFLVPPAPEPTLVAVQAADSFPPPPPASEDGTGDAIEINPAPSASASVNGRSYDDAYRSIPYNYTEYLANPGYRHDAAMELLFGAMRPTTIVRQYEPKVIENQVPSPFQPYRYSHTDQWQYRAPAFRLLNPGCCR